jgi:hypothetical protein
MPAMDELLGIGAGRYVIGILLGLLTSNMAAM